MPHQGLRVISRAGLLCVMFACVYVHVNARVYECAVICLGAGAYVCVHGNVCAYVYARMLRAVFRTGCVSIPSKLKALLASRSSTLITLDVSMPNNSVVPNIPSNPNNRSNRYKPSVLNNLVTFITLVSLTTLVAVITLISLTTLVTVRYVDR